ncbi:ead/Ea22-like family protein [Salmonella enterica subsp. enterica serovar Techimani]|nr:ead/Ea22-like family protein [Salmonella enterica subsp. enterica serovar Techimani]EJN3654851.1 ead/Ea22-like family protein [Salmonella enterica subsp. enterica serovar Techimani]EJN3668424.1 ead/Ea22-like family protein [Salmonella enterica subsp. enterica serovar Techimani]EJN3672139.1 ead/Ea22-like family protein [Salmonella enterica subsp. enterica serovar Techimani]EKE2607181.1 ead/Ea22-like family protein [Salmonella enterica]
MSNIDKQALREAATVATQGGWYVDYDFDVCHESGAFLAETHGDNLVQNAKFIAAANPSTVLALLDEWEADKEQIKALESRNRRLDGIIDAAEKRIRELDERLIEYAGIATREARRVAELEARTVNLPAACADDEYFIDGVFQALRYERDVERAIIAAGIKVKGE